MTLLTLTGCARTTGTPITGYGDYRFGMPVDSLALMIDPLEYYLNRRVAYTQDATSYEFGFSEDWDSLRSVTLWRSSRKAPALHQGYRDSITAAFGPAGGWLRFFDRRRGNWRHLGEVWTDKDDNRIILGSPTKAGEDSWMLYVQYQSAGYRTPGLHPLIRKGVCPFECCVYRTWTAKEDLDLHAEPRGSSPVVLTIRSGERFDALDGEVAVLRPVTARVVQPGGEFVVGERLQVLCYRGEGAYDVWHRGTIKTIQVVLGRDAEPAYTDLPAARASRRPVTEWWVRVRLADRSTGWILVEPGQVAGSDACG